jgi:hypothetical protein
MRIIHRSKRRVSRRAAGDSISPASRAKRRPLAAPRFLVKLVGRVKAACLFNAGPIYSRPD